TAFCVAAVLGRGQLRLADTLDYGDPAIARLVERTTVTGSDDMDAARIEVDAGGRTLVYDGATQGRDYRLSFDEVAVLFREVLEGVLPPEQVAAIESRVQALSELEDA